ncbi:Sak single strand annealing protein [Acinetobacter baumannii]|uniref:Sak single strand annealing protein n=1 Tax=Acinetobacter baumannii TaxID=470 RepID=UPI00070B6E14|nr:DUF1071 domain-containing protein [Acinetobacter baumannii]EKT8143486.1 DUF1071 domain-containing protein [Acinetobacter baumannii]EKU7085449.1 DUF1071 domain-containing protein [Acinetobacter baumannii]EKV1042114.1 DUF1071 domain-containing protein [Acinetobacter baumannii]EKV1045742.1 DUF1071 domain-containing protein [Acinetobacter baumannii]EKV1919537.1 DUF1071 domain-containing protein [Acinetobacter baumannii]
MNAAINPAVLNNERANHFEQLAAISVSGHIEKKNNMSYLSWAWAVDKLMRIDPQANWSFREPMTFPDGSMMVHCDVTVFGKTMYMFLPVMDHRNKAIVKPNAFDINKAMMRCLVKGIAVHGLGLYIYAGEDLPEEEKTQQAAQPQQQQTPQNQQHPNAAQQLTAEFQQALQAIQHTQNEADLATIYKRFKGTSFESQIVKACKAKKDMEGWSA